MGLNRAGRSNVQQAARVDEKFYDFAPRINRALLVLMQDERLQLRNVTSMTFHDDASGCVTVRWDSNGVGFHHCVTPEDMEALNKPAAAPLPAPPELDMELVDRVHAARKDLQVNDVFEVDGTKYIATPGGWGVYTPSGDAPSQQSSSKV